MEAAVLLVFAGLVLIRYALVLTFAASLIHPVRDCPACFRPTVPVLYRALARLAPGWLEWRWCPHCRWQGPARR